MGRRRFDHLVVELSVAVGRNIPRYRLWLKLHECVGDPEGLSRSAFVAFCGEPLRQFLIAERLELPARELRRLRRAVARFEPSLPTPYERLAQL